MRTVVAADLGGTKCRFALVAEDLSVHAAVRVETSRDRATFLQRMDDAIRQVLGSVPPGLAAPTAVGMGTAGVVPAGGRSIHHAPNMPLDAFPLADHVEAVCGLPTAVLNDGRASAWGEYLRGAARGADPLLCLFFGTGIGIGVMADGRPYRGATNAAGEIGHTIFVPDGRRCACGGLGHFEAYCGGRAIVERGAAELGHAEGRPRLTVGDVVAHGSDGTRAILADAERAACVLVANACTLLNPAAVVLGGGVLRGWPALRPAIERYVRANCTAPITESLRFVDSMGGSDAILWGAAAATNALG